MQRLSVFFFFILCIAGVIGTVQVQAGKLLDEEAFEHTSAVEQAPFLDPLLEQMTIEQKIGQMFMVGFWGKQIPAHIDQLITDHSLGGVILLGYNIGSESEVSELITDLQVRSHAAAPGLPLFISIDQEGGTVVRIRGGSVTEFTAQPEITTTQVAYTVGKQRGSELSSLEITVNNAPVLDCLDDQASFLYDRVFHADCRTAGELGAAMVQGYQEAGLLAAVKHFPGHCNGGENSHDALSECTLTKAEFREHIRSFEIALRNQPAMVMSAHVRVPVLDPDRPASLSPDVLQDVLRGYLGYNGMIITDDMEMQALMANYSVEEAAVQAVLAGNDMLLYVSTADRQDE
ncbi:MAG TPA: glycoside hydrolase family 3 N-terminal domain-containing protein, partial [bacterium]|nr:glycoside hydrolase family 3 N-terminal domain-containing protein [bacterium]